MNLPICTFCQMTEVDQPLETVEKLKKQVNGKNIK